MDQPATPAVGAGAPACAEPPPGAEQIEYEGQAYCIPKALVGAFLRQSDYSRKTQELAADRRALILERAAFAAGLDAVAKALGELLPWSAECRAAAEARLQAEPGDAQIQ